MQSDILKNESYNKKAKLIENQGGERNSLIERKKMPRYSRLIIVGNKRPHPP